MNARVALLAAIGCASAPEVKAVAVAPPPPIEAEASVDEAPVIVDGDAYRTALLREFRLRNRSRPVEDVAYDAHHIHVFRRIGRDRAHILLTVGLGKEKRAQPSLPFVELYAESRDYGRPIADVLAELGKALCDRERAEAFRPYATVQLAAPAHNLQFFDLVPAGEIDVAADHVVQIMKVVPVTAEEFEQGKRGETQFAGRDDATPEGSERALLRWGPALLQAPE
jgi:hypothetical protein